MDVDFNFNVNLDIYQVDSVYILWISWIPIFSRTARHAGDSEPVTLWWPVFAGGMDAGQLEVRMNGTHHTRINELQSNITQRCYLLMSAHN